MTIGTSYRDRLTVGLGRGLTLEVYHEGENRLFPFSACIYRHLRKSSLPERVVFCCSAHARMDKPGELWVGQTHFGIGDRHVPKVQKWLAARSPAVPDHG